MSAAIEQRLIDLAAALEVPPAPDVVPAVVARLPAYPVQADPPPPESAQPGPPPPESAQPGPPPPGRFSARTFVRHRRRAPGRRRTPARSLALGFAAALLLAGAALAVPPTRNAILRVLGLEGVRIVRVHRLPPVPRHPRPILPGVRISPARARFAADFRALEPPSPTAVYLSHDVPGGRISIFAGPLLVVELRSRGIPYIYKLIAGGTVVRQLRVNGGPGVYISGSPHELMLTDLAGLVRPDTVRLEGNVLVWQQGQLTIRIEGTRTLAQALALAHSLR